MNKKIIIALLLVACNSAVIAQTKSEGEEERRGKIKQESGLYVFIYSEPVDAYEFLGKINMPEVVWKGTSSEMINTAIRRGLKQYPRADAIIFQSDNFGKVDAIKFKE